MPSALHLHDLLQLASHGPIPIDWLPHALGDSRESGACLSLQHTFDACLYACGDMLIVYMSSTR